MGVLSWVRLARQVPGVVRQAELPNLEALIDAESGRQPSYNYFVLSCAIPAGIATFGGFSVFVAWLSGNTGLPLILGTALTAILTAGAWFIFYRLYTSVPPSRRHLRGLILKFGKQYGSFGNIMLGEQSMPQDFATLLDEAAGIYLRHGAAEGSASAKAVAAIEDSMARLMEVAVLKDPQAQTRAMSWAEPLLVELRLLDQSLLEHAKLAERQALADPLANLREARVELETSNTAAEELEQHLRTRS
jgi:hypothetical protein